MERSGADHDGAGRPAAIEIVRFEVPPERRDALIDGHLDARRAIRAVAPPGAEWSRLLQLDQRRWIEVVGWASRSTFDRAEERSADDPVASAWFDLAEPGWTIVIAELDELPRQPPPAEGELEVEAGGGQGWSVVGLAEDEVCRVGAPAGGRRLEVGVIVDAIDAAEEGEATG